MFQKELKNHLEKFSCSPFLFIGSGFSRRYLNLPAWETLLTEMCTHLNFKKPYDYYRSNANSNLPNVASFMAKDLTEAWWSLPEFERSRNKFSSRANTDQSPFKYEVSNWIQEKSKNTTNCNFLDELRILKKAKIDGVITTNWDTFIEEIYPDYKVYVGQDELIFSDLYTIGEIYKIHGCVSNPNSLVITAEDYSIFQERNLYLASKLLTIFMENPIVFIGYSLSDSNIQEILKSIMTCLTQKNIEKLRDRLIFCQWSEIPIEPRITDSTILINNITIPIKLVNIHDYRDLFTGIADCNKKLPIKVLRQMKSMVCDFVKTTNSNKKVYVADSLENLEDIHNAEFVWGIGLKGKLAEQGVKGIELKDLLKDVVLNNNNWNSDTISCLALPPLSKAGTYVPYFKFLRLAKYLDNNNKISTTTEVVEFTPTFISKVNGICQSSFAPSDTYKKKVNDINTKYNSFTELWSDCESNDLHILVYTPLLNLDKINPDELCSYLTKKINLVEDSRNGTHFRKLICLYDYIKYGLEL